MNILDLMAWSFLTAVGLLALAEARLGTDALLIARFRAEDGYGRPSGVLVAVRRAAGGALVVLGTKLQRVGATLSNAEA